MNTDRQTDGWMEGQMDGRTDGQRHKHTLNITTNLGNQCLISLLSCKPLVWKIHWLLQSHAPICTTGGLFTAAGKQTYQWFI